jgi:hypothetical protein
MLTEADIVTAVEAKLPQEAVNREALLRALLTEDEADLLIALRRERDEKELPWDGLRDVLVRRADESHD